MQTAQTAKDYHNASEYTRPASPRFGNPAPTAHRTKSSQTTRGTSRPTARPAFNSARLIALRVLQAVHEKGAFASLALDEALSRALLSQRDRRLAANLVYTTLENEMRIDYALDRMLENPDLDPTLRDILRLSACQMLYFDRVPDNAAVNEGVELTKATGLAGFTALTNALLRRLAREKDRGALVFPAREDGLTRHLAIAHSVPEWLVERLIAAYGEEEAEAICAFRDEKHALVLRPNLLRTTPEAFEKLLAEKGWQAESAAAPNAYLVTGAGDAASDTAFREGLFSIQTRSSILAALAVGARPGMRVLDACAAPGGKTCCLAEAMQNTGRVFAWDLHEHRVKLMQSAVRRLGLENVRLSVRDATLPKEDFIDTLDAVLIDAPCSGTGMLAEKPDIKGRLRADDLAPLCQTQARILAACAPYVKRGGTLVYSTCSILPEENEKQIEAFLAENPAFAPAPLPSAFPASALARVKPEGLTLLPHRDGLEGFFIARMARRT